MVMIHRVRLITLATAMILALATTASAGVKVLGTSGWVASWNPSFDSPTQLVDVAVFGVVGDAVFIQKSIEFTQGLDPNTGTFPGVPIHFTQVLPGAVGNIVVDDEIILNSTGNDWFDFHMELTGDPSAVFDPAATLASSGPPPIGFTIDPFTTAEFANGNRLLNVNGGTVPNGGFWFPGDGLTNGQLWINVTPSPSSGVVFTLTETPTVPEPGSAALVAI